MSRREICDQLVGLVATVDGDTDGIDAVINFLDDTVGHLDGLFRKLGRRPPKRDDEAFLAISDALAKIDPKDVSTRILLTILTGTLSVRDRIPNRFPFFARCAAEIVVRNPGEAHEILQGLGGADGL